MTRSTSVKETKQEKKTWWQRLETRGGVGQYLKKEGGELYRRLFIK